MFDMTRTFDYARTEGPGHEVFTVTDRTRLTGVTRRAALPPPLVIRQRTPLTPHHQHDKRISRPSAALAAQMHFG